MDRRRFCQSTFAAAVAAHYGLLTACERSAPTATDAASSVAAVTLDGTEIELERAALRELGEALQGPVLLSDHADYDVARRIWNGMHDRRPALIARVANTADIQQAVTFARERNLLTAVRGGGHSWPGKSVCEGGMMIDLSSLNGATVDAQRQRAAVGGGALLNTLDSAALEHGLVTTAGVVSHTGVGGFTLGGGFGRLNRKYGLTIDNLVSAEIVTADGEVRIASADNEPDLFWAIRGGGGNFGVVSGFEYQLHPFDRNVLSGIIHWPIDQAREVLDFYSDWYRELSDELYVGPMMYTLEGNPVVAIELVYAGDPADGEREIAPLRALGRPIAEFSEVIVQDYMVMQTWDDAAWGHGVRSYAKNGMAAEFSSELVDVLLESFVQDPRYFFFTHTAGGAVKRVGELETAFPHRNAETMLGIAGIWDDPEDDAQAMADLRAWFAALEPFTGGYYDNIEHEGAEAAGNYGPAYDRLRVAKGKYDPGNLFRMNSNIEPA